MIYYLGYYDINDTEGRSFSPAAKGMMDYVADVLSAIDRCEIISASTISSSGIRKSSKVAISDSLTLKKFHAVSNANRVIRHVWGSISKFCIAVYCLRNIKHSDVLVVYHSLALLPIVKFLRAFKKAKLILEVNEVYNDVVATNSRNRKKEIEYCQDADGYILACNELNQIVNVKHLNYVVINGATKVSAIEYRKFNDGHVHVVYAGTLAPEKGGAAAAAAAAYLPPDYVVHILGFGSKKQVEDICSLIKEINKSSAAEARYEGVLYGDDFSSFIGRCHVGLSTQNPDAAFNASSFPSKILTYMSVGLKVVSIRTPVIEGSSVGKYIFFYDKQNPQLLAAAIVAAANDKSQSPRSVIEGLDLKIREKTRSLISNG